MPNVIRHDDITLHENADAGAFEAFMTGELMPYFDAHYRGPTRVSIADIVGQSLLRRHGDGRRWRWVSTWVGPEDAVAAADFERTRIGGVHREDTQAMLHKLEGFGKRTREAVFSETASSGQ